MTNISIATLNVKDIIMIKESPRNFNLKYVCNQ